MRAQGIPLLLLVAALALSTCVCVFHEEQACERRGGVLVRTVFGVECVKKAP